MRTRTQGASKKVYVLLLDVYGCVSQQFAIFSYSRIKNLSFAIHNHIHQSNLKLEIKIILHWEKEE